MYSVWSKQNTQSMMNKPIAKETSDSLRIPILSPDTVERVATAVIHHISVTYIIVENVKYIMIFLSIGIKI